MIVDTKAITKLKAMIIAVIVVCAIIGSVAFYYFTQMGPAIVLKIQEFRIGVISTMTGSGGINGLQAMYATEIAVNEINKAGGILGKIPVKVYYYDDRGDPGTGVTCAEKAITVDGVNLILGPWRSGVGLAVADVIAKYKVPMINPHGGGSLSFEDLIRSDPQKYKYLFMQYGNAYMWGAWPAVPFITDVLKKEYGLTKYAIIGENLVWAHDCAKVLNDALQKEGCELVYEGWTEYPCYDFSVYLSRAKEAGAQFIYLAYDAAEAVTYCKQWYDQKIGIPTISIGVYESDFRFWNWTEGKAQYHTFCNIGRFIGPDSAKLYPEFLKKYLAYCREHGIEESIPTQGAFNYDAVYLVVKAVEKTLEETKGEWDSDVFVEVLEKTTYSGVFGKIEFYGLDGEFPHRAKYGEGYRIYPIMQYLDGKPYIVYPPEFKEREWVKPTS